MAKKRKPTANKVYIADAAVLADAERFCFYYEQMPPYRKKKIDAVKQEKSKRLSLGAGILLNTALRAAGVDGRTADMAMTDAGKPFIKNRPDLGFNLSQSGDRVMCAVAGASVGCDVERIGRGGEAIAQRYFTAAEYAAIRAAADPQKMFCRLWTLKESYVKAVGAGLGMPLNSFNIVIGADGSAAADFGADAARYRFYEWSFDDGYCYACCIENGEERPVVTFVDFAASE